MNFGQPVFKPLSWGLPYPGSLSLFFFSFSINVNKALLLLRGISLPGPAINISLALSYLARVLALGGRQRDAVGSHSRTWLKGATQFRGGFRRSNCYWLLFEAPPFTDPINDQVRPAPLDTARLTSRRESRGGDLDLCPRKSSSKFDLEGKVPPRLSAGQDVNKWLQMACRKSHCVSVYLLSEKGETSLGQSTE